jgi:hypothetical protein
LLPTIKQADKYHWQRKSQRKPAKNGLSCSYQEQESGSRIVTVTIVRTGHLCAETLKIKTPSFRIQKLIKIVKTLAIMAILL